MPRFVSPNAHVLQRPNRTHGEGIDKPSHHQSPVIMDSALYDHAYKGNDTQDHYCHLSTNVAGKVAGHEAAYDPSGQWGTASRREPG